MYSVDRLAAALVNLRIFEILYQNRLAARPQVTNNICNTTFNITNNFSLAENNENVYNIKYSKKTGTGSGQVVDIKA